MGEVDSVFLLSAEVGEVRGGEKVDQISEE